jgi:hypothetical protein
LAERRIRQKRSHLAFRREPLGWHENINKRTAPRPVNLMQEPKSRGSFQSDCALRIGDFLDFHFQMETRYLVSCGKIYIKKPAPESRSGVVENFQLISADDGTTTKTARPNRPRPNWPGS